MLVPFGWQNPAISLCQRRADASADAAPEMPHDFQAASGMRQACTPPNR